MRILVDSGVLRCGHDGLVSLAASQSFVRIASSAVLVESDPEGRTISMCPNYGVNIKPCTSTLVVRAGYSTFIRIGGRAACLDSVVGFTDGTPPGAVDYTVRDAGQSLVGASS